MVPPVSDSDSKVTLGPASKVSIALLTVCVTATAGGVFWVAQVNSRLTSIEQTLNRDSDNRWTATDMHIWTERLRNANPALSIPIPQHYQ